MQKILFFLMIIFLVGCSSEAAPSSSTTPAPVTRSGTTTAVAKWDWRTQTISKSPAATEADPGKRTPTAGAITQSPAHGRTQPVATSQQATRTPRPTLRPDEWQKQPIIPAVSDTVVEIYQRGLELGNDPHAFSKLGDCGSTPAWFLGDFDRGPKFYDLGPYQALSAVIQEFQGSFGRTSLAARSGFNASALNVPLWADRTYCQADETPLACEYRVHKPILAFIMLGTNDVWHPQEFEPQMRKIIEYSIENGVIPVLSTKADNQEGDGSINDTIARLANEYDLPLWNYWAAVYPLPDHGLQEDKAHLTWGRNNFSDPEAMTNAWPVRNLTALQVLNVIWRKVSGQ